MLSMLVVIATADAKKPKEPPPPPDGWDRQPTPKGECNTPLTYTMFDYLDIGKSWQRAIPLCKGNKAHIVATAKDRYRISDTGAWINVEGDTAQRATQADFPCNIEGCFVGMLVG